MAAALFICALLSKTSVVSLPIVVLLYIWWKRNLRLKDCLHLLPFFAAAILAASFDVLLSQPKVVASGHTAIERGLLAGRILCFYVGKLFWPANLMTIYPRWEIDAGSLTQYVYPAVLAIAAICLVRFKERVGKGFVAACLFYVITLGPVLGFVDYEFMGHSYVADRYAYLSTISVIAVFAAGMTHLARRLQIHRAARLPALFVLLGGLGTLTWISTGRFHDMESLFRHNLRHNPDAFAAHVNIGTVLAQRGEDEEAIQHYNEALRIKPDYAIAYNNLGFVLDRQGRIEEAINRYRAALQHAPGYPDAHMNLGIAHARQGKNKEAVREFTRALELKPALVAARINLAIVLDTLGERQQAVAQFETAVKTAPDDPNLHYNFANTLARQKKVESAAEHLREALRLRPGYFKAHVSLGAILASSKNDQAALVHYREAVRIDPNHPGARFDYARLLARTGQLPEARKQLEAVLQIKPDHSGARAALGRLKLPPSDKSRR